MILALVGLALVLASLAALSFAWGAADVLSDRVPLAPTLFTLPAGGGP